MHLNVGKFSMVRAMRPEGWPRVEYIYKQGIERGTSTFTTECPNYEQWNQTYKKECRFVCEVDGVVAGFVAISPVSSKAHYSGVAEVCIYVDEAYWRQGIGVALLNQLCEAAFGQGYWMLYSSIFSDNIASIELHKKCGFRLIGYREKIAKNRFGQWQSTTLMEKRKVEYA